MSPCCLVELLRPLGQRPGAQPMAVALRHDRRLEGHCATVNVSSMRSASSSARSMSSRAALKSRCRREQRERHSRMCERRLSQGIRERSARSSASRQQVHGRVDRRELVAADAHPVEDVCALDIGEPLLLGRARAPESSSVERRPELARDTCAPTSRRAARGTRARVPRANGRCRRGGRAPPRSCWPSIAASARVTAASTSAYSFQRLAGLEVRGVDAEPLGDPRERLVQSGASCRARSG